MGQITETKTVKINLPNLIEEFYYALENEDYKECEDLKEYFYSVHEDLSDSLKRAFMNYLTVYLKEHKIDNKKDLNGLFNDILDL